MKKFLLLILLSLSISVSSNATSLTRAVADWTGGMVTCEVAEQILEQELGYKIDSIFHPSGTALWKNIRNQNGIDFACETWPSFAEADDIMIKGDITYGDKIVNSYNGDGSIEAYTNGIIGTSDYFVPKYFVDANPDFKDWRDLNKFKDQFTTDQTGRRGRLIGCSVAGWNCHDQKRLDLLGIDFYALEAGSETASLRIAEKAYNKRKPFLLYLWEPHWFLGKYEMVRVNLPKWKPCNSFTEYNNWKDCGTDAWPATGWAKDYTMNYMNPKVFDRPEMVKAKMFFQNMQLDNMDQSKMIYEIDKNGRNIVEVVQEWKDNNENIWRNWLANNSDLELEWF